MNCRPATLADAELLIRIYNAAFYDDYLRFGFCPGYGKTIQAMEESIRLYPKYILFQENRPVGCISCKKLEEGAYEIGCLCVVPEFQRRGIGYAAMQWIQTVCGDWKRLTLVTPLDKAENMRFYTRKCGFRQTGVEQDGPVRLARLVLER